MSMLPGRVGHGFRQQLLQATALQRTIWRQCTAASARRTMFDAPGAGLFWAGAPTACCQTARTGSGCARACSSLPDTRDSTDWAAWPSVPMGQAQTAKAALCLRMSTRRQSSPQTQVLHRMWWCQQHSSTVSTMTHDL